MPVSRGSIYKNSVQRDAKVSPISSLHILRERRFLSIAYGLEERKAMIPHGRTRLFGNDLVLVSACAVSEISFSFSFEWCREHSSATLKRLLHGGCNIFDEIRQWCCLFPFRLNLEGKKAPSRSPEREWGLSLAAAAGENRLRRGRRDTWKIRSILSSKTPLLCRCFLRLCFSAREWPSPRLSCEMFCRKNTE